MPLPALPRTAREATRPREAPGRHPAGSRSTRSSSQRAAAGGAATHDWSPARSSMRSSAVNARCRWDLAAGLRARPGRVRLTRLVVDHAAASGPGRASLRTLRASTVTAAMRSRGSRAYTAGRVGPASGESPIGIDPDQAYFHAGLSVIPVSQGPSCLPDARQVWCGGPPASSGALASAMPGRHRAAAGRGLRRGPRSRR